MSRAGVTLAPGLGVRLGQRRRPRRTITASPVSGCPATSRVPSMSPMTASPSPHRSLQARRARPASQPSNSPDRIEHGQVEQCSGLPRGLVVGDQGDAGTQFQTRGEVNSVERLHMGLDRRG